MEWIDAALLMVTGGTALAFWRWVEYRIKQEQQHTHGLPPSAIQQHSHYAPRMAVIPDEVTCSNGHTYTKAQLGWGDFTPYNVPGEYGEYTCEHCDEYVKVDFFKD